MNDPEDCNMCMSSYILETNIKICKEFKMFNEADSPEVLKKNTSIKVTRCLQGT